MEIKVKKKLFFYLLNMWNWIQSRDRISALFELYLSVSVSMLQHQTKRLDSEKSSFIPQSYARWAKKYNYVS